MLVEAVTYRFRGHSMADPEEYRSKEQVEEWRKRDPIATFARRLVEEGVLDEGDPERIDEAGRRGGSTRRSRSPTAPTFPPPESLYDEIYVLGDQVRGWYSVDERSAGVHRGEHERELAARERGPEGAYEEAVEQASSGGRRAREGRRRGPGRVRRRRGGGAGLMGVVRYREALNQALREEMERDESVVLMGEDIGVFNGAFKVTAGLLDEFGEKRVRDTPISENTIVGMGVGAAMTGLRPVVELMTINFSLLAMDQIVNHAATIHYMFGGQVRVPLVIRMPQGAGHQLGPTHSHSFEALYLHVPGLLVAVPSTPADAKGLLKSAIRDDNPVVFIEHEYLYGQRGDVPGRRRPHRRLRARGDPALRRGRHDRRHLADGADRGEGGEDPRRRARGRGRGDRSRAPCGRSTSTRSSSRCARPTAA